MLTCSENRRSVSRNRESRQFSPFSSILRDKVGIIADAWPCLIFGNWDYSFRGERSKNIDHQFSIQCGRCCHSVEDDGGSEQNPGKSRLECHWDIELWWTCTISLKTEDNTSTNRFRIERTKRLA